MLGKLKGSLKDAVAVETPKAAKKTKTEKKEKVVGLSLKDNKSKKNK